MLRINGTLQNSVISTASSPAVHYSVGYSAVRTDTATVSVAVKLTVSARLGSSLSKLGTGIVLTFFARLNGGVWRSVVLKKNRDSWHGTGVHTADLTLSGKVKDDAAVVEWYVSRVGSTYGGTAGVLGSAAAPEHNTIGLPGYVANSRETAASSVSSAAGCAYIRVDGVWRQAVPYVKSGGIWKRAVPYVRVGGVWKST